MKAAVRSRVSVFTWALTTVRRADPRGARISAGLQLLTAASALGVVLASRLAIESVTSATATATGLVVGLGLLALSIAVSQAVAPLQQLHQRVVGERVNQHVWETLMRTTVSVGLDMWQRSEFMGRVERIRDNSLFRPVQVVTSLFTLLGSAVSATVLLVALFALEPLLIPLLLLAGVPAVLISRRVSRMEFGFVVDVTPVRRRTGYLKRLMTEREGAAELRAYASAPYLMERNRAGDTEYLDALRRHVRRRLVWAMTATGFSVATLAATFALIGYLLISGRMSVATAGAAAIGARLLATQLAAVFASLGTLVECGPFLRDLQDFGALYDPSYADDGRARELTDGLRLDEVRFAYPGRVEPAVDGVSIDVPAGRVVMLVGENGSGKTTLAKLAAGLYAPDTGTIAWDGDGDIPLRDLRASVSVLFQDFVRYQMTVAANIAVARAGDVDEAAVGRAAERANVADVVDRLPDGYLTLLGLELAEGAELSGGQWQRLALARAFYRDSPLVVLDEPTAALDPRAEHELLRDVRGVLDGRAALLISHRYSSAHLADYIYVMDDGRVLEEGTHAELMAVPGGRYAELYTLQASAYLSDQGEPDGPPAAGDLG